MNASEIKEIIIKDNPNAETDKKRLEAQFTMKNGKVIKKKFGQFNSLGTYADGATNDKRSAYVARHRPREKWDNIFTAGSLSRYVLWQFRTNREIEQFYKIRFNIPRIKVNFKRYKM